MPRTRGTRDPRAETLAHAHWVEMEYGVDLEWTYVPLLVPEHAPRTRCCLTATFAEEYGPQDIHWFICCYWPANTPVKAMEAERLLMVSKLQMDIQMWAWYGKEECIYLLPAS